MCGHIIHEKESKLVRWGVTQAKAYSQNRKDFTQGFTQECTQELHKDLHKDSNKELHNYLHNFWGVKDKNSQ